MRREDQFGCSVSKNAIELGADNKSNHRVETYSVNGGFARISLARPKSQIFTCLAVLNKIFSGFISRWKKP